MNNTIRFTGKVLQYAIFIAFLIFFSIVFFSRQKLKSNYLLSNAIVTSVGKAMAKNGNWLIEYTYLTAHGKQMKGAEYHPVLLSKRRDLIKRIISVAYSPEYPEKNQLLIYEHTWKQYDFKFLDSLKWLKGCFDLDKVVYTY
jgi:hypothetical protein